MISDLYIHLNITFKNTVILFHSSKLEMGLQGHPVNIQLLLGLQSHPVNMQLLLLGETAGLFFPVTVLVWNSYGNAWEFQLLPVPVNTWYCRYFFLAL